MFQDGVDGMEIFYFWAGKQGLAGLNTERNALSWQAGQIKMTSLPGFWVVVESSPDFLTGQAESTWSASEIRALMRPLAVKQMNHE
jgi:hypothetical protein